MSAQVPALPWLQSHQQNLARQLARGLMPQALLIHGAPGVGRRELASWLVRQLLPSVQTVADAPSDDPLARLADPDLACVQPLADSRVITIGQIRELISFLQLTSHRRGRKLALIYPAETLNSAACNSLLKTLEEPPGNTTLVLVSGAPARLPATIRSRCQRLRLGLPERAVALAWLRQTDPDQDWDLPLTLAGGAPLLASRRAKEGFAGLATELGEDLGRLAAGEVTAPALAKRWAGLDTAACLHWLYWQLALLLRSRSGVNDQAESVRNPGLDHLTRTKNMKDLHRILDQVAGLIRLLERSLNVELQLAGLLATAFRQTAARR